MELRWPDAKPPRVGSVTVNRRPWVQVGAQAMAAAGPTPAPVLRLGQSTRPGIADEYQVIRAARDIVDVGYWATGVDLPAVEARGTAHVVVDEASCPHRPRLARFERDLTGDGWQVARHWAPRGQASGRPPRIWAAIASATDCGNATLRILSAPMW